jgi:hypothetical protein
MLTKTFIKSLYDAMKYATPHPYVLNVKTINADVGLLDYPVTPAWDYYMRPDGLYLKYARKNAIAVDHAVANHVNCKHEEIVDALSKIKLREYIPSEEERQALVSVSDTIFEYVGESDDKDENESTQQ